MIRTTRGQIGRLRGQPPQLPGVHPVPGALRRGRVARRPGQRVGRPGARRDRRALSVHERAGVRALDARERHQPAAVPGSAGASGRAWLVGRLAAAACTARSGLPPTTHVVDCSTSGRRPRSDIPTSPTSWQSAARTTADGSATRSAATWSTRIRRRPYESWRPSTRPRSTAPGGHSAEAIAAATATDPLTTRGLRGGADPPTVGW